MTGVANYGGKKKHLRHQLRREKNDLSSQLRREQKYLGPIVEGRHAEVDKIGGKQIHGQSWHLSKRLASAG